MTIDTTPRTYKKGRRPRVIIEGWEEQEVYLTRINSRTAYFRGPYYVGELAVDVEKVIEIKESGRAAENTPQTSASDRIEAAREALAEYDRSQPSDYEAAYADPLADALRALITPPSVGESEEEVIKRAALMTMLYGEREGLSVHGFVRAGVRFGFHAGIDFAHERWEPEVAQRPSQEQMLRWLGVDTRPARAEGDARIFIPAQHIEREEI